MNRKTRHDYSARSGLTLVEIMMAMVIFLIVLTVVVKTFSTQQNALAHVDQRSDMQINARNALYLLENQIQMMGFSPDGRLDCRDAMDYSGDCRAEGGILVFNRNDPDPDKIHEVRQISINLLKSKDKKGGGPDGIADSGVGATGLIIDGIRAADNIVAVRFAYAFDEDADGSLDLSPGGHIIWAVDADQDGRLEMSLDTDDDGDVDETDAVGGAALGRQVDIARIRAVKVWLLARSSFPLKGVRDNRTFAIGGQRCRVDDYYGHVLLETAVRCRNMRTG